MRRRPVGRRARRERVPDTVERARRQPRFRSRRRLARRARAPPRSATGRRCASMTSSAALTVAERTLPDRRPRARARPRAGSSGTRWFRSIRPPIRLRALPSACLGLGQTAELRERVPSARAQPDLARRAGSRGGATPRSARAPRRARRARPARSRRPRPARSRTRRTCPVAEAPASAVAGEGESLARPTGELEHEGRR